jgi:hypothetical protein
MRFNEIIGFQRRVASMNLIVKETDTTNLTNERVEELKQACFTLDGENRDTEDFFGLTPTDNIMSSSQNEKLTEVFFNITPSELNMAYKDMEEFHTAYHWETCLATSAQYALLDKAIEFSPWGSDQYIWTVNKLLQKSAEEIEAGHFNQASWILSYTLSDAFETKNKPAFFKAKIQHSFPKNLTDILDQWELAPHTNTYDLHYDFEDCDKNFHLALPHLKNMEDYFGENNDPDRATAFYHARLVAEMKSNTFLADEERKEFAQLMEYPANQLAYRLENASKLIY